MPESPEKSHLAVKETDGVCVVEFSDRKILDELSITEIQDELTDLVQDKQGVKLLLHFGAVEHMSSAALAMLINLNEQIKGVNGVLKLSDIIPQIYEVFKITRLNKLFDIHKTAREALAAF